MFDTVEQAAERVAQWVTSVGAGLEPEDDWLPILFTFDSAGKGDCLIGIPDFADDNVKPIILGQVIPSVIAQTRPRFAALVVTAWAKQYTAGVEGAAERARDEAASGRIGKIEGRPGVREIVMIFAVGADGTQCARSAFVERHDNAPPTLEWRTELGGASFDGAIPKSIASGFKAAARGRG